MRCIKVRHFRKFMGDRELTSAIMTTLCLIFLLVPSSPPANLTAYNTSSTSIRVSWDPVPTAFRQGFILGYRVYLIGTQAQLEQHLRRRKRTSMPTGNEIFMDTANLTTEFQGLEKYSNYCVQGVAYTRIGESNRTNATCVSTDEDSKYTGITPRAIKVAPKKSPMFGSPRAQQSDSFSIRAKKKKQMHKSM